MDNKEFRAHSNFYPLVDLIIDETYQRQIYLTDNLRLRYHIANDDKEKDALTLKLKKKVKKKLSKCTGTLHDHVYYAITNPHYFYDETAFLSQSVHSLGYYNLTIDNLDQLKESDLDTLESLKSTGYHFIKPFIKFVKMISLVGLYHDLCSLEKHMSNDQMEIFEQQKIKWYGSQTELIELLKSLIENENLRGTQKEIINTVSTFFGIKINNPDKLIQDIKKRNTGSETLFLDKLKSSLYTLIQK